MYLFPRTDNFEKRKIVSDIETKSEIKSGEISEQKINELATLPIKGFVTKSKQDPECQRKTQKRKNEFLKNVQ